MFIVVSVVVFVILECSLLLPVAFECSLFCAIALADIKVPTAELPDSRSIHFPVTTHVCMYVRTYECMYVCHHGFLKSKRPKCVKFCVVFMRINLIIQGIHKRMVRF